MTGGRVARSPSNSGEWEMPFEVAIACSSSVFVGVVRDRARKGIYPIAPARISAHGRRLIAVISYPESDICFQLDVALQERAE